MKYLGRAVVSGMINMEEIQRSGVNITPMKYPWNEILKIRNVLINLIIVNFVFLLFQKSLEFFEIIENTLFLKNQQQGLKSVYGNF